jgi:E1A/CREB-binding protein
VQEYDAVLRELKKEQRKKCENGEACLLCGTEKLNFEPPVFYCNGANCSAKRIRRNSYYYVAKGNQ